MKQPRYVNAKQQRGAVLAISLILLLVITIVGLSGIETTGLEEKMAANAQFQNLAFQSSEGAISQHYEDRSLLGDAYAASVGTASWPERGADQASSSNGYVESNVQVRFVGHSLLVGNEMASSIVSDRSSLSVYHYEVRGTSSVRTSASESAETLTSNTNVRGAYTYGPRVDAK